MLTLHAECLLDFGCSEGVQHVLRCSPPSNCGVYTNTSTTVKARTYRVITSSIAVELIDYLDSLGEKDIWAPDHHFARYVQKQTVADMLCWQSACVVQDEFKIQALRRIKRLYPDVAELVHPNNRRRWSIWLRWSAPPAS